MIQCKTNLPSGEGRRRLSTRKQVHPVKIKKISITISIKVRNNPSPTHPPPPHHKKEETNQNKMIQK